MTAGIRVALGALLTISLSGSAFAQTARANGTVKDTSGRPIKGATVRAINPEASPSRITSTTDNKGRWAMIGLRTGTWTFVAEAPGFTAFEAAAPVRVSSSPPMGFVLARDPGPIPGALDKNVMQLVKAANTLRDRGQLEQALDAYQQIRDQNPKLTSVNLVIAGVYRKQAVAETDPTARRALLDRAIAAYSQLLNDEDTAERAKTELEATRAEAQVTSQ